MGTMYVVGVVALLAIIIIAKTAVVVPQQSAYVVETLGRYNRTIQAGFHILKPFFDRIAYKHNLKEEAMDIPEQVCITRDNVQVGVDGVLYMQVLDASKASYGITNYRFAIIQLAQTTLRSEIGKIELDRTFEERATINANVVTELDKASAPWGVKVLRYEIKNINPPKDVLSRDGEADARRAREARGRADLRGRARREDQPGRGREAARHQGIRGQQAAADQRGRRARPRRSSRWRRRPRRVSSRSARRWPAAAAPRRCSCGIAEEYVKQFGTLANEASSTLVVPANLSDVASMIALATNVVKNQKAGA